MHLLPRRRSQWEAAPPVSLRHCQCQWPLVAVTFWIHNHLLSAEMDTICGQSSLHPSVLGTLGIWYRDQSIEFVLVLHGKRGRQEMCFMFSCRHKSTKGGMLFKLAIGQNLQNEGRALFLPIYLYYICTDLKKKKNLKWRRIWHLGCQRTWNIFCLLELSWCLGLWKKIIEV